MSRTLNKLNSSTIRGAKPKTKSYKLADGGGLYLEVAPTGSKYWRMKYRFNGKEKRLSIGVYGSNNGGVTLADAREARDRAKILLAQQVDPSSAKKLKRTLGEEVGATTFKVVAKEWLTDVHQHNVVPSHFTRNERRLEIYAYSQIGDSPIAEIKAPQVLACLRKIEDGGNLETAKRVKTLFSQIFRYAVSIGKAERDVTFDLKGSLKAAKPKHYPALITPSEVSVLLRAIDTYGGHITTLAALKLSALLFVRPGELRQAKWQDIDFEDCSWSFIASKTHTPHLVPLPKQAMEILHQLKALTGTCEYVIPSVRSDKRPMSNNTIRSALHTMDFKGRMTPHGFRAMARTMLAERLEVPDHYIEQQLAHSVKDTNGRAYNRTQFLEQRREMMQQWADYLDELRHLN